MYRLLAIDLDGTLLTPQKVITSRTHQLLCQVSEAGIAIVIATGYRNVVSALRGDPDTGRLRLGYFVAAAMYGFTEAAFRVLNPVWILFLLVIVAVQKAESPRPSRVSHCHECAVAYGRNQLSHSAVSH